MSDSIEFTESLDFATFITDLGHGDVNRRLGEELSEVIAAVQDVDKVGTMTIKLTVKKNGSMAIVATEVTSKIPKHSMEGQMFWFGKGGMLHTDNPKQLKLRDVVEKAGDLRVVPPGKKGAN